MNPEKTRIRIPIALIDQLRIKYPELDFKNDTSLVEHLLTQLVGQPIKADPKPAVAAAAKPKTPRAKAIDLAEAEILAQIDKLPEHLRRLVKVEL